MVKLSEISVIVPTRNELHNVPLFLSSLPTYITLVVVDSSDDETPHLILSLRPANTIMMRQKCPIAVARQLGAERTQTPWLLFTDSDVTFTPGYFDRLQTCDRADALYGLKLSGDHFAGYYSWFARAQGWSHRMGIPAASGSNLVIRRQALLAVGGFDMQLRCNEDSEIAWRLKRSGYRLAFAPELVVMARDHRRLRRGILAKTLHSIFRCTLLYFNLMPACWRSRDWDYWKPAQTSRSPEAEMQ